MMSRSFRNRTEESLDLAEYGFGAVHLMDGERVDTTLHLVGDPDPGRDSKRRMLLLTDCRLIHLDGDVKDYGAVFTSLRDVDAIEIGREPAGAGAFAWAALAFIAALFLYFVLDEQGVWQIAGAAGAALLGAYLIGDRLISSGETFMVLKMGPAELRCALNGNRGIDGAHSFIRRFFELKSETDTVAARVDSFAPR